MKGPHHDDYGLQETADFDSAIGLTGYGKFHVQTILICSVCVLVMGFQNGISSYILPSAQIELGLTSFEVGLMNVSFLTGGILSCFLWGILADMHGRRKVLVTTSLLNSATTIIFAVIPAAASLVVCRFLNGFFIGAPGSIIFTYFSEFQPTQFRALSVCYCGVVFTISWLLLPALSYIILPIQLKYQFGSFIIITSWRFLLLLIALPEVIVGLGFLKMPESPKYFAAKGKTKQALLVLRKMYAANTGKDHSSFPVKNLICGAHATPADTLQCRRKIVRILCALFDDLKSLFGEPLSKVTSLTCTIMFANMFGIFGLGLWLPDLFIRFEEYHKLYPNSTISVSQLSQMRTVESSADDTLFDETVMKNTVVMATTSLVYNVIFCFLSWKMKMKPRIITMFSMTTGGAAAIGIYWMTSSMQNLIVACVFQATMITANMNVAGIGVELFPTRVNGLAICCIMCAGRLGAVFSNVVFGYYIDTHCEVPIFAVGAVVLFGGLLCLFVPTKTEEEK